MAEASYPDDLLYHPEHDWARVDGEEATLGITWYAQDQLGEVVFFEPPEVGKTLGENPEKINDDPYGGGWMVRIRLADPGEKDALLSPDAYASSLQ